MEEKLKIKPDIVIDISASDEWNKDEISLVRKVLNFSIKFMSKNNPTEISIRLTGREEIKELNKMYRDKDSTTNVLSFCSVNEHFHPDAREILGDIVISKDTVLREANDSSKNFEQHLSHLGIHGLLHLLGYSHDKEKEALIMEGIEVEILNVVGNPSLNLNSCLFVHQLKLLLINITFLIKKKPSSLRTILEDHVDNQREFSISEKNMLTNIIGFGESRVEDSMVPRADIIAVDVNISAQEVIKLFSECNHSRIALYRSTLDDPVGMLHIKDFVRALSEVDIDDIIIEKLAKDIILVPRFQNS